MCIVQLALVISCVHTEVVTTVLKRHVESASHNQWTKIKSSNRDISNMLQASGSKKYLKVANAEVLMCEFNGHNRINLYKLNMIYRWNFLNLHVLLSNAVLVLIISAKVKTTDNSPKPQSSCPNYWKTLHRVNRSALYFEKIYSSSFLYFLYMTRRQFHLSTYTDD